MPISEWLRRGLEGIALQNVSRADTSDCSALVHQSFFAQVVEESHLVLYAVKWNGWMSELLLLRAYEKNNLTGAVLPGNQHMRYDISFAIVSLS